MTFKSCEGCLDVDPAQAPKFHVVLKAHLQKLEVALLEQHMLEVQSSFGAPRTVESRTEVTSNDVDGGSGAPPSGALGNQAQDPSRPRVRWAPDRAEDPLAEVQVESVTISDADMSLNRPSARSPADENNLAGELSAESLHSQEVSFPTLRDEWTGEPVQLNRIMALYHGRTTDCSDRPIGPHEDDADRGVCCDINRLVLNPWSPKRMCWDVLTVLVISYDLLTLPLMAFGFGEQAWAEIASGVSTLFWAVDIGVNFFIGFQDADGHIELRPRVIASVYLKSWFPIDIFIVILDVALFLFDSTTSDVVDFARFGKAFRAVRVLKALRLLRLLRIFKMAFKADQLMDMFVASPLMAFLRIFKLLFGLAVLTHFGACCWYALAIALKESEDTWLAGYENDDLALLYLIAFHWIISQFTPASHELHPTNFHERLFAVFVLFLGLVVFSSLLGSVTALINQSRKEAYSKLIRSQQLGQFLADRKVSVQLGSRIARFYRTNETKKTSYLSEQDVTGLRAIPQTMLHELHFEVYGPVLQEHPPFKLLSADGLQEEAMVAICHHAASEVVFQRGEEPFHYRQKGKHMLFIQSGSFQYHFCKVFISDHFDSRSCVDLAKGERLSELVLFFHWEHRGLLTTTKPGLMCSFDAKEFHSAVKRFVLPLEYFKACAQVYASNLRQAVNDDEDLLNDLVHVVATAPALSQELLRGRRATPHHMPEGDDQNTEPFVGKSLSLARLIKRSSTRLR